MALNRPPIYLGVAFNADPFDASVMPTWIDLTSRCLSISEASRGRQYELDQNQAGRMSPAWLNIDEALNPVNAGSPFAPNLLPYRQLVFLGMWPPAPVGAAVNLINLAANGADPSFESYTNGAAAPSWLTPVGSVVPTITVTSPQQGTQCVTYTVAGTATVQGLAWTVPCIPGQQYTASAFVRQSSASIQQLQVGGFYAYDTYSVPATNGWSPADSGQAWVTSGGAASDHSVSGGAGLQSLGSVNVFRNAVMDIGSTDFDITVDCTLSINSATGAMAAQWICGRLADLSNHYIARLELSTSGSVSLTLLKRVAGTLSAAGTATTVTVGTGHIAGDRWRVRFTGTGPVLSAWAWMPSVSSQPPSTPTSTTTDTSLTAGTQIGLLSRLESGNTNTLPVTASWRNLSIQYASAGTSTTTTGAYVRLTETFVAQQPTHTVQLATIGAAVAGTVFVDALQHEPGGSANAFSATGPILRSLWTRGYVERWPTSWDDQGYRGQSSTPVVGPLAILANANLHTEIHGSIMAKKPDYSWTLQEPIGATVFAESSGNNGPPLQQTIAPAGPGPTYAPGTAMNVAGDAGGVGVRTAPTPGNEGLATGVPFTCLQLGYGISPQLVGPSAAPGASPSNWFVTMAVLMTRPPGGAVAGVKYVRFTDYNNSSPVFLLCNSGGTISGGGVTVTDIWNDNRPHLYVQTTQITGGTATIRFYVDGTLVGTVTGASGPVAYPALALNVGGAVTYTFSQAGADQTVSHLAYWNRVLSAAEIADLANAAKGYAGETEAQRLARYLAIGGYVGPTAIRPGASIMGAATVTEGAELLATCQGTSDSAFGNFFEASNGLAYSSRFDRYFAMTSVYTFGENTAGGEYPYEGDINFDMDPTLVYDIADVTRSGGIKAHAEDGPAQLRYGRKPFTRTIGVASDNEAQDAATWVVANRKAPLNRVASVTLDPGATVNLPFGDGTMWPMIIALEIGTRVTLRRRPKAANGGTGIVQSGDFFVENINHHDIDFEQGTWKTTLLLSPVYPGQPWILQDATYGQLDVTTVLGF